MGQISEYMSDHDVLQAWKQNRFIIADPDLVDHGVILVVLADYKFWATCQDELTTWCKERNATVQGMTVVFGDAATLTEFILKWS